MMESAIVVLLTVVLVTAMCTDLRSSRIPNWLTFPAMGFALVAHAWLGGFPGGAVQPGRARGRLRTLFDPLCFWKHRSGRCETDGSGRSH